MTPVTGTTGRWNDIPPARQSLIQSAGSLRTEIAGSQDLRVLAALPRLDILRVFETDRVTILGCRA